MSTAITQYEDSLGGLTQWRPPETVLAEAKQAADALTKVISLKKNPVKFNGEIYLEFEDWQTCAKFYGVTAKVERTAFVQYGNVAGFEATAVAIDRNGAEISRAESLCLNDEANWGMVPQYEWKDVLDEHGQKIWVEGKDGKKRPKAERVQVGEAAKPLFQLKSMAQTRACSKVLRQVFAWIVVLAGYRPTPAEEMTGQEQFEDQDDRGKKPPVSQPQRASEKAKQQTQQTQTAQQTSTAPSGSVELSGVIENAKDGKEGMLWLTLKAGIVMVPADKVDGDMKPGYFIKFHGIKKHSEKIGDYYVLSGLQELSEVQSGEVSQPTEQKGDPQAINDMADDLFGKEKTGKAAVQGMVDNGTLKPASELPATKSGTIGKKRAQRLYAIAGQNAKTTGFTEDNIKKVLAALPIPLEHLSDLETGMYETFEKLCSGAEDWTEYLKDE